MCSAELITGDVPVRGHLRQVKCHLILCHKCSPSDVAVCHSAKQPVPCQPYFHHLLLFLRWLKVSNQIM